MFEGRAGGEGRTYIPSRDVGRRAELSSALPRWRSTCQRGMSTQGLDNAEDKIGTHVDVDNIMISVIVHLLHPIIQSVRRLSQQQEGRALTCSESLELPHPSIKMRAFLSGIRGRMRLEISS